ncbi:fibrinogen beta chain-like [Saccostrea cucullata]|uniref:fibrinogen beta chain-like n=1 Tax=Saccostrea cuccullata TaxID=36930 RepID=UPI002ED0B8B3
MLGMLGLHFREVPEQSYSSPRTVLQQSMGLLSGNAWVSGNDVINQLTKRFDSSLYVSITQEDDSTKYELYYRFSVADESDKYFLYLEGPATGTLGDRMLNTGRARLNLSGAYFSTPDRDNDNSVAHCGSGNKGGWWYNDCHNAFLNGRWEAMKVCENNDCQSGTCLVDSCNKRGYRCSCFPGYSGDNCEVNLVFESPVLRYVKADDVIFDERLSSITRLYCYQDCKDIFDIGNDQSGVYTIYPNGTILNPVSALCDMETQGGGWTVNILYKFGRARLLKVIQKRNRDENLSFERTWEEYKNGFGTPTGDTRIGNDVINQLTKGNDSSLYVSITLATTFYEMYDRFSVSDETDKYRLFLSGPATGTLGDRMLDTGNAQFDLSGMYFSTPDRNNDNSSGDCGRDNGGGWWYNDCHRAFQNGV